MEGSRKSGKSRGGSPKRGTAPSAADISELEPMEPSEEAKRTEPSDVDAMGQDKRRQVIGHAHGPSRRSQLMFFGAFATAVLIVIGGYFLAIAAFDQPEDEYPDRAPWASPDAPQNASAGNSPRSPSGPCGEPGSPTPAPASSPCARGQISNDEPPLPGEPKTGPESGGSGGVSNSGGEAGGSG